MVKIFENATLGDKYILKNHKVAIFLGKCNKEKTNIYLLGWNEDDYFYSETYNENGNAWLDNEYNIDHKYQYDNEQHVNYLARKYYDEKIQKPAEKTNEIDAYGYPKVTPNNVFDAYIAGFLKGIEER